MRTTLLLVAIALGGCAADVAGVESPLEREVHGRLFVETDDGARYATRVDATWIDDMGVDLDGCWLTLGTSGPADCDHPGYRTGALHIDTAEVFVPVGPACPGTECVCVTGSGTWETPYYGTRPATLTWCGR